MLNSDVAASGRQSSRPMLHEDVVDTLGFRICEGQFPPGYVFTLEQMCERFSVSRTVAREAMRLLEGTGMVISRRRLGIVVQSEEHWDSYNRLVMNWRLRSGRSQDFISYFEQMRLFLEPLAARLCAMHATAEQIEILQATAAGNLEGGGDEFSQSVLFHQSLIEFSGNVMLVPFNSLTPVIMEASFKKNQDEVLEEDHHLHKELRIRIAQAIAERDPAAAEQLTAQMCQFFRHGAGL